MGNFVRRNFGGRSGDRQMFKAICSNCGKPCEVPFHPTNGKPVYCHDCFGKMKGARQDYPRQDSPRPERPDFKAPRFEQNTNQLNEINIKLDKILKFLEPKIVPNIISVVTPEVARVKKVIKKSTSTKKKE